MKHNLNELDQFFDAARSEAPLMDDQAFAALVNKADAAPPTEIMKDHIRSESPTRRLLSAIRQQQGGMIMTGLGLTAITGLLITGPYLSTDDTASTEALKQQASTVAIASEVPQQTAQASSGLITEAVATASLPRLAAQAVEAEEVTPPSDPVAPRSPDPLSTDSLWSRVKIGTIKPIEVTAADVAELGINETGDGKVFLVHELGNGKLKMTMTFPPHIAHDSRPHQHEEPPKGAVTEVMPTMVTDAQGKKLAFFFKTEHGGQNFDAQFISMTQRDGESDEIGAPVIPELNIRSRENGRQYQLDVNNKETNLRLTPGPDGRGVKVDINRDYELTVNGDDHETAIATDGHPRMKFKMQHFNGGKFDSLRKAFPMPGMKMMVMNDSAFKGQFNFDFKFDMDSSAIDMEAMQEQGKQMRKHALTMQINGDSIRMNVLKQLEDLDIEGLGDRVKIIQKELMQNFKFNIDSMDMPNLEDLPDMKDMPMMKLPRHPMMDLKHFDLPNMRIEIEKINKLIPIQIKRIDATAKFNQNGLIFWYMPDERFVEKAPASVRQQIEIAGISKQPDEKLSVNAKTNVVSESIVYPNPSPGRAMFKYTLSEPRAVSIAVHDLLGKQVLKISDLEFKSAGSMEKELDLSELESGVYLLVMVTDAGEQVTQRVVLEK